MPPIRKAYIEQCHRSAKWDYAESLQKLPADTVGLEGEVADLTIYPGKALGGLSVEELHITEYGLQTREGLRDRAFMLGKLNAKAGNPGEPTYKRFSQRQEPQLSKITPHWDGKTLAYIAKCMPYCKITPEELEPRDGDLVTVEAVPGTIVNAIVEKGPIGASIRQYLRQFRDDVDQIDVLLPAKDFARPVEDRHRRHQAAQTMFSDGGQILLASQSSLDWVQEYVTRRNGTRTFWWEDAREILMSVVRPNITVSGWPENLEDILDNATIDGILPVMIGNVRQEMEEHLALSFGDLCVRCKVTQVDPATGTFAEDYEPFDSFLKKRPLRLDGQSKSPTFAVNAVFPKQMWGGVIKKGTAIDAGTEKQIS